MKRGTALFLVIGLAATGCGVAGAPGDGDDSKAAATAPAEDARDRGLLTRLLPSRGPEVKEVVVPEGTELRVALASRLSSADSDVEDRVRGVLREDVSVDGLTVLPAGATVDGTVVEAERSGRVKGTARLAFRFDRIVVDGESLDLRAARLTYQAQPTKKDDAVKVAIGAGAGAIAGAIAGGRKGAAIGTGVGAAAGTGVVLASRGDEVILAPGTVVRTRLTSPLTVRVTLDD
ncbi:MAG: hypothetical protein ACLGHP_01135 [Vicinamibacteria bacterium]